MSDEKLRYPRNITWMIEVRDWRDSEDAPEGGGDDSTQQWKKYAPAQPSSSGTGVVIRLEQLDDQDRPLSPRIRRNYLLTCGHVVRIGGDGFARVGKEIICWKPATRYKGTQNVNIKNKTGRLKGRMDGGYLAKISEISPYDGRTDEIPEEEQKSALDWVLLDLEEKPPLPAFDKAPFAKVTSPPKPKKRTYVMGYPGGAGQESRSLIGGHFWEDGKHVRATTSSGELIDEVDDNGVIHYYEEVKARRGMSGGGVFDTSNHALVGLHRSRDDEALRAQALSVVEIANWLLVNRHLKLVRRSWWLDWIHLTWITALGAVILVIVTQIGAIPDNSPRPTDQVYVWRGVVRERVMVDGTGTYSPVDGAKIVPHLNNADVTELEVTTPGSTVLGPGEFEIRTTNPEFFYQPAKLKISKGGYKTLVEDAYAVPPRDDDSPPPRYTLEKEITP